MSPPPHAAREKAEGHELSAGDRQPVETTAAHDDRHDAGRDLLDPHDLEPVGEAAHERQADPVRDHDAGGQQPQADPVGARQGVAQERRAGGELVRKGDGRAEVGVQVDRPPCLGAQMLAHVAIRGDAGQYDQAQADDRAEHPREVGDEHGELVREAGLHALRVAQRDEERVGGEQADHPRSETAMPGHERVLAERALDCRYAPDKQHGDQQQVRAQHAGHAAKCGGQASLDEEVVDGDRGDDERECGDTAHPGKRAKEARPEHVRPRQCASAAG